MSHPQRILSGMRSTNERLHIGNYEGALRRWVELQKDYKMYCMVADWHALTEMKDEPINIRRNSLEIAKDFVAGGLDPNTCSIFIQSEVKEHAELSLLLGMVTGVGKLERNPTYKDKAGEIGSEAMISFGLLGYPVLQAADILLYKPYGVPVGKDQAPHLELSREIARAFNARFGEVFPEFKDLIYQEEFRAKVPGLDMRKMSKSYGNCIYLNDTADETARLIKSAYTTPSKLKKTDPGIPEGCAVCQMLRIYSSNWETQWAEDVAGERGCMQNKTELTEALNEYLRPIRERRAALSDDDIIDIVKRGANEAREFAASTMDEVRTAMKLS